MKKRIYTGARKSRYLFNSLSLVLIFLPLATAFGIMYWGDGFLLPFWCSLAGASALFYILSGLGIVRKKKKSADSDALMHWKVDREFWREYRQVEFHPSWNAVVTQAITGLILFLVFLIIPRTIMAESGYDIAKVDAIMLIALCIWLFSLFQKWIPMIFPREIVLAQNGVFSGRAFVSWGGKTTPFDGAVLEKRAGYTAIVIHYRITKGMASRSQIVELTIPVQPEMASDAEIAITKLNKGR